MSQAREVAAAGESSRSLAAGKLVHQFLQIASLHLAGGFLHHLVLFEQSVEVLNPRAGALQDATFARAVKNGGGWSARAASLS